MEKSLAPSTRHQYRQSLQKCQDFIKNVLLQPSRLPVTQDQLHMYVAHLHSTNIKHSTISTHVSAISHYHKMAALPDPTTSYATAKLLTGVRNTQGTTADPRRPISKHILLGLLTSLQACTHSTYQQLLFSSMFALMYSACLRASEVMLTGSPQHILTKSQLVYQQHNNSYRLTFSSYKHSTTDRSTIHVMPTGAAECPVFHLEKYIKARGNAPGPLFIMHGSPITRAHFTKVLQDCLKYLQLPARQYNTHSFRIGRTTDMALANTPHSTIQQIGRWKSTAYLKYIRTDIITTNP